ncbi:hypothetical protein EGW08_022067 [Elysia chlorotica]|uniref:Mos1 transposase HTH domain-containing protein n=1 Tax=Elysia chlorotica TaxID=188477 RepID=A0A3S0Z653_ELYCH|nr:hypothetical protein EGW08_022067 [Elysia chlorotica]
MVEVYAEKCPNYSTVTHWVRKFKSGFLSVMDEPREGRPTSVVTEKNVSTVEGLVKQDRRITVKQLASETRISTGRGYRDIKLTPTQTVRGKMARAGTMDPLRCKPMFYHRAKAPARDRGNESMDAQC